MNTRFALALTLATTALLAGAAPAQDITCVQAGSSSPTGAQDFVSWGTDGGFHAYSGGVAHCNRGALPVAVDLTTTAHPVTVQNLYRIKDGALEQIGMSWAFHLFCALNLTGCGTCQPTSCSTLGVDCTDVDTGSVVGSPNTLTPRSEIDPTLGTNAGIGNMPGGPVTLAGRVRVRASELDADIGTDVRWIWDTQYVAADDAQAGNGHNNVSYREVEFLTVGDLNAAGATVEGRTALHGWAEIDGSVTVTQVTNADEGGPGIDGLFWVASSARRVGALWRYRYAVFNQSSDQAARAFELDFTAQGNVSALYFHDVDYHSGELYDGADWTSSVAAGGLRFETFAHGDFANANALRWGTTYSFGFDSPLGPGTVDAGLELFKPGAAASLAFQVTGPAVAEPGVPSCFGVACPCANDDATAGCANSTGAGGALTGSGSTSVTSDDLVLTATGLPTHNNGLFYMGDTVIQNAFYDGFQCALGTTFRFLDSIQSSGAAGQMTYAGFAADAPALITAGTTWHFHCWHRDVPGTPCGTGANLTNLYSVLFTP